jgi:sporulation protein YlmC with PRC-barrel domain
MTQEGIALERLAETPFVLDEGELDLRNRVVRSAGGDELGTVKAMYVDAGERKVRLLTVASGGVLGIGETEVLVPVEAISRIDETGVHLAHEGEQVSGAPRYDPTLVHDRAYWETVYGWFGYTPYWGPMHPGAQGYPHRRL